MGIPDPIKNCALEICCLNRDHAQAAYAKALVMSDLCDEETAKKWAAWQYEYFDLAPAGTLAALFREVARLARV